MRIVNFNGERKSLKKQLHPSDFLIRSMEYCINNICNLNDFLNTSKMDYSQLPDIESYVAAWLFELSKYEFLKKTTVDKICEEMNIKSFYYEGDNIWEV